MASRRVDYSDHPSLCRAGASSSRSTGLPSLPALAGESSPATEPDRIHQEPNKAVIITRLVPQKHTVVPVKTCEPPSDDTKQPVSGDSSTKADKPTVPENFSRLAPRAKLKAVKQFLSAFEYKQTPATHFNTHKLRPLTRIMDTARMIIYSPQPIKCVEAVFLALYLTAGIADCDRIPLGFKTSLHGQVFQHIVLLVQYGGKFGAFGISRQPDLMNKDLTFNSMSNIVENFITAYEAASHTVLKIRVGLPVEHKVQSPNYVCWRHLSLSPVQEPWEKCREALENHSMKKNKLWDRWLLAGKDGQPKRKTLACKAALDTRVVAVKDAMTKKKKVKTQDTTMKAFAETDQSSEAGRSPKNVPASSTYEAQAGKDRKRGGSLAARKSLTKARLLQSKKSFSIRQSAQCIAPKLCGYSDLGCGSLTSSQAKMLPGSSSNIDNGTQDLIDMTSTGKEQGAGERRIQGRKEQVSTGVHSKRKLSR